MAQLTQLSTIDSERGRAFLAAMLERRPYLRFLEEHSAFEEQGTEFLYYIIAGKARLQRRALGGEYDLEDRTPSAPETGRLAFVGDSIDVDRSHREDERRGLLDIDRWIDKELTKAAPVFAKLLVQDLFQGSGAGTPRQITGLSTILDGTTDVPGFETGFKGTIDAANYASGNSFDLTDDANWDPFIEALELWLAEVDDPRGIVVNRVLGARLTSIARNRHMLGEGRDLFGRPVPTFNGVPIIREDTSIIPNDEPDNASTPAENTTSLYIESPGEGRRAVVTNSGLQFDDLEVLEKKESERVKWEVRADNVIEERDSIRRVRNIRVV